MFYLKAGIVCKKETILKKRKLNIININIIICMLYSDNTGITLIYH